MRIITEPFVAGCTPYSLAISLVVFCPRMASRATFAFNSALYRFLCPVIFSSLLELFSIQLFYLMPLSESGSQRGIAAPLAPSEPYLPVSEHTAQAHHEQLCSLCSSCVDSRAILPCSAFSLWSFCCRQSLIARPVAHGFADDTDGAPVPDCCSCLFPLGWETHVGEVECLLR